MLNKKIFEVLQQLDKADIKKFRLFLQSPYFNRGTQSETLLRLFDDLAAHRFDELNPNLSKASVFARFYPDITFVEAEKGPLDALTSELFKHLRRFLTLQKEEAEGWEEKEALTLINFYRKNGLDDRFKQSVTTFRKALLEKKIREHDFFQNQYQLEYEQSQYQRLHNTGEDDANVMTVDRSLDIQYLLKKLDLICALEYQGKLTNFSKLNSKLTQLIQDSIIGDEYPESPLIEVYISTLKLIQQPESDVLLEKVEQLLEKHQADISYEYQQSLSGYYRNYWIRKYLRVGSLETSIKVFSIFKNHFERGFFYIDGKITAASLRNLLNFALKTGQTEWIKTILDTHPPEKITGTKYAVEIHSLNYAEYYFYQQEYETALEHLVYRNFENPTFSILADVLLIKVFYETQNELLEYRVNAMRQKIVRAGFATEVKSRYHNFINKMEKLIKYGWEKNSPKMAKLHEETTGIPNIIEREWLLEKMAALAPKNRV
jgi:hypothetical protein